ncbi:MAG TPA: hypothetical protein PKL14_03745 [Holophaga sp.]|nr:hypothetical protein [Holophaga sp.]
MALPILEPIGAFSRFKGQEHRVGIAGNSQPQAIRIETWDTGQAGELAFKRGITLYPCQVLPVLQGLLNGMTMAAEMEATDPEHHPPLPCRLVEAIGPGGMVHLALERYRERLQVKASGPLGDWLTLDLPSAHPVGALIAQAYEQRFSVSLVSTPDEGIPF